MNTERSWKVFLLKLFGRCQVPRASINVLVLRCREFSTIWKPPSFSCCALQQFWCVGIFVICEVPLLFEASHRKQICIIPYTLTRPWVTELLDMACYLRSRTLSTFLTHVWIGGVEIQHSYEFQKVIFRGALYPCMDPRLDSERSFFHVDVWTDVVCVQKVSSRYGAMVFEKMPDWYSGKNHDTTIDT